MILKMEHIYKDYIQGKMIVPVLKDINLEVEEGEYVAIMGPSGSGKSTLMNIIGCLDKPTKGTFFLDGQKVLEQKENQVAEVRLRSIGFVFQNFQLLPKLTALDNVALPLIYAGVKKKERRKRAKLALERVGLGDRLDFVPNQLSGGQKQRVAIARAMVNNPKILLADEPTGALDSKSSHQVMELFAELNREGVTVIMITHDAHVAECAKRIVDIFDGEISERTRKGETA
ncbi:MAG: ABC transporter ATP-binding protein [Lachnospiraceae bacterium]|nr:ABC transporter ATP-binding protein [Lachnospiraceae bacterium]